MTNDFEMDSFDWLDDFGLKDDNQSGKKKYELTATIRAKYKRLIEKTATTFRDIVVDMPAPGEQVSIVTDRSFNAVSVVAHIYNSCKVDEIHIAIFRMNLKSVDFLKSLFRDKSLSGTIMFSCFFQENKNYERWADELISMNSGNLVVKTAWSHAKVVLVKTKGAFYVFEGSGNLTDNARIEQYTLTNDRRLYEFHKKWIQALK